MLFSFLLRLEYNHVDLFHFSYSCGEDIYNIEGRQGYPEQIHGPLPDPPDPPDIPGPAYYQCGKCARILRQKKNTRHFSFSYFFFDFVESKGIEWNREKSRNPGQRLISFVSNEWEFDTHSENQFATQYITSESRQPRGMCIQYRAMSCVWKSNQIGMNCAIIERYWWHCDFDWFSGELLWIYSMPLPVWLFSLFLFVFFLAAYFHVAMAIMAQPSTDFLLLLLFLSKATIQNWQGVKENWWK